jgi:hypothetical protein
MSKGTQEIHQIVAMDQYVGLTLNVHSISHESSERKLLPASHQDLDEIAI